MRPILVEFQAFGPYTGHEIIDFEKISSKGLFLICGETGSGKTMILDAMTIALYGKSSGHGRDDFEALRCTSAGYDATTFVRFIFELNGKYFHFERRLERKVKRLSASYSLMQKDDNGIWQPLLENPKEKDLSNKAYELIGLDYEQFRQVIVLPQGQFEKLLVSSSDEKEKILTNIFGEDKWQSIAQYFFNEVSERRERLKLKKERINSSLLEENCSSLEDLNLLILKKKKEEKINRQQYESSGFEAKLLKLQESLVLANRFFDFHKLQDRKLELEQNIEERKKQEMLLKNAKKADKVRRFIVDANFDAEELSKRELEMSNALDVEKKEKSKLNLAEEALNNHNALLNDIEIKKETITIYESKKSDYEGTKQAQIDYDEKKQELEEAKKEEAIAKENYESYAEIISNYNMRYTTLNNEHAKALNAYISGITGELASKLSEGMACPVCGSKEHPCKAQALVDSVSKEKVDNIRQEADKIYNTLQSKIQKQEEAKRIYNDKASNIGTLNVVLAKLKANLDSKKKNFIKGIDTLDDLIAAITNLRKEVAEYEIEKEILKHSKDDAKNLYTEAMTKIKMVEEEIAKTKDRLDKSVAVLQDELHKNEFQNVEEAKNQLLSSEEMEKLQEDISKFDADYHMTNASLQSMQKELKGKIEPEEIECKKKMEEVSTAIRDFAKQEGILKSEIDRLISKEDKLRTEGEDMELSIKEVEEDYQFAKRLRGDSGTGLQRYVLGIMFSSVILAANKMLELVHDGRYRLFRCDDRVQGSMKRGLELKVYDKYSNNPEGRFVNTLSGGEKFLASLALSIGMSTVAQKGGLKVEALFIDEGFGSLDENSIVDAMNILNSIREANGMVGIISHVQLLQERIPTKLYVNKLEGRSHITETIG